MNKSIELARPELERIVTMRPAFHRVHEDPKKNYGVGSVSLRMVLKGPLGAVQFLLLTNWYLPQTHAWWGSRGIKPGLECVPADKGYHWTTPQYEGQEPMDCDLLPGGKCYYDGSGLNADELYQVLLKEGSDGVWRELEEFYHDMAARKADAA